MDFSKTKNTVIKAFRSERGRNAMVFMVFVCVSAVLWMVLTLNEDEQTDLRLPVQIVNVPDSVTLIKTNQGLLSVSVHAKGSHLIKLNWGGTPVVKVDFRAFADKGNIRVSSTDLKALVRNATGGSEVNVVYPDTLLVPYTSHPGYIVRVEPDAQISTHLQYVLKSQPELLTDSVRLYFSESAKRAPHALMTEPVRLSNLEKSVVQRVRVLAPAGSRAIPDSVDLKIEVEPLLIKSRKVNVRAINVPENTNLLIFPGQVTVNYMVPMSIYKDSDPVLQVVADYRDVASPNAPSQIRLRLVNVPSELRNVYLSSDSSDYIIEKI